MRANNFALDPPVLNARNCFMCLSRLKYVKGRFSLCAGVRFVNFYCHRVLFQVICIVRAMPVLFPSLCFIRDGSKLKQVISSYYFFAI